VRVPVLVVVVMLAAAVAGSGSAASSATKTKVTLSEFKVVPKPKTGTAGKVTFVVANAGSVGHELVVLRTSLPPGKLPVRNGRAVEKGKVGQVGELAPGKSGKLTRTLKKGRYVLLCNVPGHYQAGQFVGFLVR
jgi:uncharacterized cupredoxin-like copper-binding protein